MRGNNSPGKTGKGFSPPEEKKKKRKRKRERIGVGGRRSVCV
jgi:hypothetical protein